MVKIDIKMVNGLPLYRAFLLLRNIDPFIQGIHEQHDNSGDTLALRMRTAGIIRRLSG